MRMDGARIAAATPEVNVVDIDNALAHECGRNMNTNRHVRNSGGQDMHAFSHASEWREDPLGCANINCRSFAF
jgi:hypothetical protein